MSARTTVQEHFWLTGLSTMLKVLWVTCMPIVVVSLIYSFSCSVSFSEIVSTRVKDTVSTQARRQKQTPVSPHSHSHTCISVWSDSKPDQETKPETQLVWTDNEFIFKNTELLNLNALLVGS